MSTPRTALSFLAMNKSSRSFTDDVYLSTVPVSLSTRNPIARIEEDAMSSPKSFMQRGPNGMKSRSGLVFGCFVAYWSALLGENRGATVSKKMSGCPALALVQKNHSSPGRLPVSVLMLLKVPLRGSSEIDIADSFPTCSTGTACSLISLMRRTKWVSMGPIPND